MMKVIRIDPRPDRVGVLKNLQGRLTASDLQGARADCRAQIEATPDGADAHRHLGQLRAGSGEFLPASP